MPKIGPPFKKEDFFFSEREKRIFFIGLGVVCASVVLGLLVIAVVAIFSGAAGASRPAAALRETPSPAADVPQPSRRPSPAASSPPAAAISEGGELLKPMSLNAFVLPDDFRAPTEFDYALFLARTGKWDRAAIEKFWVEPRRIGLENLRKLNDKNIESLFEGVQ